MNAYKLYYILVLLLTVTSCQSKKTSSDTMKISESKMIENGFKKATVVYSTIPEDCEFTLAVEGETVLFDPINLEGKFQKSQAKIWVKYIPLRMPNRCEKALPVEITEVKPRH